MMHEGNNIQNNPVCHQIIGTNDLLPDLGHIYDSFLSSSQVRDNRDSAKGVLTFHSVFDLNYI